MILYKEIFVDFTVYKINYNKINIKCIFFFIYNKILERFIFKI